jgi:alanyl-tRNA synthetase
MELTESILAQHGLRVDREGFLRRLEEARARSREAARFGDVFERGAAAEIRGRYPPTIFLGYQTTRATGKVLAIVQDDRFVQEFRGGEALVLLDQTPFYGEGGGQIGDTGWLRGPDGEAEVIDTQKPHGYHLHRARITRGGLRVGDRVDAEVDAWRRLNIMRNHTGTHVLHAALRAVLGEHARQVGSRVMPDRLTFDFTHPAALSRAEIRAIEDWCNRRILEDHPVTKEIMPIDEARKAGAIMFFDEKYGEQVRVVTVGDFSKELCGGTHLDRSSTIGWLKIVSESSVGSGVRRIEAVTGPGAVAYCHDLEETVLEVAREVGAPPKELPRRVRALQEQIRLLRAQIARLKRDSGASALEDLAARARSVNDERVVVEHFEDGRKVEELREMMDVLVGKGRVGVALLGTTPEGGKPLFVIGVRRDLVARGVNASALARAVGRAVGSGGGGRDHLAQTGAPDAAAIPRAHEEFLRLVAEALARGS